LKEDRKESGASELLYSLFFRVILQCVSYLRELLCVVVKKRTAKGKNKKTD
jgi:hypothetical protein